MKSIVLCSRRYKTAEYFKEYDFVYIIKEDDHSTYLEILEWLEDNDIWYHSVHRDISALNYEVLYMSEENAMAFKLRWL